MIRTIFVWSCIVIATLVLGAIVLMVYPFDRKGGVGHRCARLWGRVALLANRVKVVVEGLENIKSKGPFIFMSNHQGSYDIFVLLGHLPFHFKWLAKKELFSIPFFGWAMGAAGYISIDRQGTQEAKAESMNQAAKRIQEGMSVVIFPEGARSQDGSIQPFKKGGFILAMKAKVPIIPISIAGSREIMAKDRLTASSGDIRIKIGDPIETGSYSIKDRNALIEMTRETILKNYESITQNRVQRLG